MSFLKIRVRPGGWWDRFWSAMASQPTVEWRQAHATVRKDDLRVILNLVRPVTDLRVEHERSAFQRLEDASQ